MSVYTWTAVAATFAALSTVSAHGKVSGIVAGGQYYPGYTIDFAYRDDPPPVVGWSVPQNKDTGFVNPANFSNPNVICDVGATPAQKYVTVAAGATVELQWTKWPESHHGPVIDYLANCNGQCTEVEKSTLRFNKIDEQGLVSYTSQPGSWASDKLIAANNSWTVTVPKSVAPGNYVLRHEIIALHSADKADGAQNYPQCINLKVTGSGTDKLASGTLGTELYTPTDPGILVNIYQKLTYIIPGPKLYSGAESSTASTATAVPSSGGYGATPSASAASSATPVGAYPTAAPLPTGPYSNSSATLGTTSPIKIATKEAYKSTGNAFTIDSPIDTASTSISTNDPSSSTETAAPVDPTGSEEYPLPSSVSDSPIPSATPEHSEDEREEPLEESPEDSPKESPEEPKHKLPEGMTVKELLEWLQIIVTELQARMGGDGKVRRHARDFLGL
ncbi:MAG: hypothetical protein Q9208_003256 [Pyrenodesmia sp. 3 TL-2023]